MRVILFFSALLFVCWPVTGSCFGILIGSPEKTQAASEANLLKTDSFSFTIIAGEYSGFGYDINVNGRRVIHQPCIPGLSGKQGFVTKEHARRVAGLVINKMKRGQRLPTVSRDELKSLGIIQA